MNLLIAGDDENKEMGYIVEEEEAVAVAVAGVAVVASEVYVDE